METIKFTKQILIDERPERVLDLTQDQQSFK
jgi:hypothetical protein